MKKPDSAVLSPADPAAGSRTPLLDRIDCPDDIKRLSKAELLRLCAETRRFLIDTLSQTGGHVASNLGVVELTVALHRCFDTERDRLVFDVGHQCYAHKLFTGRRKQFSTLRQAGGLSGFPKPSESVHDAFIAGHASNSISVALGLARVQQTLPPDRRNHVVALIGDGAMTGGLAYEALNDAGAAKVPLIVILNDNGMSIGKSVGALARLLTRFRVQPRYQTAKKTYHRLLKALPGGDRLNRVFSGLRDGIKYAIIPNTFFESMGFEYIGPVDGHDVLELSRILEQAKSFDKPVLIHVITQKGRGYPFSEGSPERFHGVDGFDVDTGCCLRSSGETFSAAFGAALTELAAGNPDIFAITAAMKAGVGLTPFAERFPERFIDVGIAEEHAVTMASGLAAGGKRPVVAIYATFLQRAFDEMLHDTGIMRLPVVFCVDRCGLIGEDGETHQGLYDLSMLKAIPGMTVYMPSNACELRALLRLTLQSADGPVAIRYPRGQTAAFARDTVSDPQDPEAAIVPLSTVRGGSDITLLAAGRLIDSALTAADLLAERGISAGVLKLNRVHPLPLEAIFSAAAKRILVLEEAAAHGSAGSDLAAAACNRPFDVYPVNCGDRYIPQAAVAEQFAMCGLDPASTARLAEEILAR